MKQNKTLIKELRRELHYHQEMVRVDLRALLAGRAKCKELGAKMRVLQNGSQPTTHAPDVCHECGGTEAVDKNNDGVPVCVHCGTRR